MGGTMLVSCAWFGSFCSTDIKATPHRHCSRLYRHNVCTKTYVSGTGIYPHIQILRPHPARFHDWRISSVTFTSAHFYGNVYMWVGVARALADSSDFGLLGEQSSPKCEIPCLGRRWTAEQNVTPLALFSTEKSVTHTKNEHTRKQTNSNRHIRTLPIGLCG